MESFFASLKKKLVHRQRFKTRAQAKAAIFEYIEVFYNRQRRHSGIGYKTPEPACEEMTWKRSAYGQNSNCLVTGTKSNIAFLTLRGYVSDTKVVVLYGIGALACQSEPQPSIMKIQLSRPVVGI